MGSGACAAQERTPDRPTWENASFRNHADHTATPEFREGMAELRDLGPEVLIGLLVTSLEQANLAPVLQAKWRERGEAASGPKAP